MTKRIALIPGDGIGPEIVSPGHGRPGRGLPKSSAMTFTYTEASMGGNAIDRYGVPLPRINAWINLPGLRFRPSGCGWRPQVERRCPAPSGPKRGFCRLRAGMGVYSQQPPGENLASAAPPPLPCSRRL